MWGVAYRVPGNVGCGLQSSWQYGVWLTEFNVRGVAYRVPGNMGCGLQSSM